MSPSPEARRRLALARDLLSAPTQTLAGRYPVEHDPIRRYCHMVEDTNAAYLDPHAADPPGRNVCPPSLVPYFALPGAWPPDDTALYPPIPFGSSRLNLAISTRWFRMVRVGDRLSCRFRYVDVFHKPIRADQDAVWYVLERMIWNGDGQEVCIQQDTGVAFTPQLSAPTLTQHRDPTKYKGIEDPRSLVFEIDSRRLVLATSGSQDLYELHYDADYARERGQDAPVVSNVFLRAAVDRLLSDRLPNGRLAQLDITIRRPVLGGDTLRVSAQPAEANGDCLTLSIAFDTERGQCATAVAHIEPPGQGATSA